MKRRSLTRICEKLVDGAMQQAYLGDGHLTEHIIREHGYAHLSERFKPGRVIMAMRPEDREILKEAKEKDFNGRLYFIETQ
jgi:hypothetical protein